MVCQAVPPLGKWWNREHLGNDDAYQVESYTVGTGAASSIVWIYSRVDRGEIGGVIRVFPKWWILKWWVSEVVDFPKWWTFPKWWVRK